MVVGIPNWYDNIIEHIIIIIIRYVGTYYYMPLFIYLNINS